MQGLSTEKGETKTGVNNTELPTAEYKAGILSRLKKILSSIPHPIEAGSVYQLSDHEEVP
jgi:hypothetical protein